MSGTSKMASARAHQRAPEPHIESGTVGAFGQSAWSPLILKAPTPSSLDQHAGSCPAFTHAQIRRADLPRLASGAIRNRAVPTGGASNQDPDKFARADNRPI